MYLYDESICENCNTVLSEISKTDVCLDTKVIHNNKSIIIRTLLDSGSLQANYLDHRTFTRKLGLTPKQNRSKVHGIFGEKGGCAKCSLSLVIPLVIDSEVTSHEKTIVIEAKALEGSPFPLILGLLDIRHYHLSLHYFSFFNEDIKLSSLLENERLTGGLTPEHPTLVLETNDTNQNLTIDDASLENKISSKTKYLNIARLNNKDILGRSQSTDLNLHIQVTPEIAINPLQIMEVSDVEVSIDTIDNNTIRETASANSKELITHDDIEVMEAKANSSESIFEQNEKVSAIVRDGSHKRRKSSSITRSNNTISETAPANSKELITHDDIEVEEAKASSPEPIQDQDKVNIGRKGKGSSITRSNNIIRETAPANSKELITLDVIQVEEAKASSPEPIQDKDKRMTASSLDESLKTQKRSSTKRSNRKVTLIRCY